MERGPVLIMSAANIEAVSWLAFTKVVALVAPSIFTIAVGAKLLPFMVIVNAPLPVTFDEGERPEICGAGFCDASVMVRD